MSYGEIVTPPHRSKECVSETPCLKLRALFFWVRLLPELTIYHAYHLRNGMFGHDGAYGTDLSVNPKTGMVAIFMVQCSGGDQWAARELFLKTATRIFPK